MRGFTFLGLGLLMAALALSAACGPGLKGAIPTPALNGGSSAAASSGGQIASAGQAAEKSTGNTARGKTLFEGTCASCHGKDAKGLPNLGKDLTTSAFAKGQSDKDLIKFLTKGRPASDPANTTGVDMPPRGGNPALKDADLNDIVAYVRTLEK